MASRAVLMPIRASIAVAVGIGFNLWLGYSAASVPFLRVLVWVISLSCILCLIGTMGKAINGRWDGIIIDARNKVSLSKLQATAWSVLVLSSLATYAATRAALAGGGVSALDFSIPNELLIAMGIAAASLVASPAVLSLKTGSGDVLPWDAKGEANIDQADGKVAGRSSPDKASWLDIFRGDEVTNADAPDLSKVQQFLITLVLIVVYGTMIANALISADVAHASNACPVALTGDWQLGSLCSLPILNERMVWLLGISHAAYIGYKAVPHSGSDIDGTKADLSVG